MRTLVYVPIIHADPDLGSVGVSLNRKGVEVCGKARWRRHKEIVAAYWRRIRDHFSRMDARGLAIYQDGLMADGALGRRIIEEGAGRGSPNHQIVLDLIRRGAAIRKTEDVELLKKEFDRILQLAEADPAGAEGIGLETRTEGGRLLTQRDRFIAETINQTLEEGETAILFIGAFHTIMEALADDIEIIELKNPRAVRAYFETLLTGRDEGAFEQLAAYLVSDGSSQSERFFP
jgi:hypothetical protein